MFCFTLNSNNSIPNNENTDTNSDSQSQSEDFELKGKRSSNDLEFGNSENCVPNNNENINNINQMHRNIIPTHLDTFSGSIDT